MASAHDYLGNTSKTQDLVLLGILGVGLYVVYQIIQGIKATAGAAADAGKAVYHGAQVVATPVAAGIAAAWDAMTLSPPMKVLGNVIFPDGSQVPLSQLTVKTDTLGNVYVASPQNGLLLQLQPSDANGNWPAVQITDPSQIGQVPGSANSAIPGS